ncbi:hypothetical protein WDU94_011064 [Cyamophila willieti]
MLYCSVHQKYNIRTPKFLVPCLSPIGRDDGENSGGTHWLDVDVKADAWKGISVFLGRDLCEGEGAVCADNFTDFLIKYHNVQRVQQNRIAGVCETDKNLRKAVVCWVRYKPIGNDARTKLEVQFWSDNPQTSHCRYAYP